jgi:Mrp family chromosome partitioning ATPase
MSESVRSVHHLGFDEQPNEVIVPVVFADARTSYSPAELTVMNAVRYLLDRYLLSSGAAELPQRIAVVSAAAGEGVTTVSTALAELLASQYGNSVCWIDVSTAEPASASRPAPTVVERSTVSPAFSLELAIDQTVRPATLPVTSGGLSTVDLRSVSRRVDLDMLTKELAADYRNLVFDVPPLFSAVGSIGLLRNADAYLLVARQGSTSLKQARAMAEALDTIPSLGAILNDFRTRTPRFVRRFFAD